MSYRRWGRGCPLIVVPVSAFGLLLGVGVAVFLELMGGSARAQTTYECVGAPFQITNSNGDEVSNGGMPASFDTLGEPYCLISVSTYHWNDGNGQTPGMISLTGPSGELGPWAATGGPGEPTLEYPNGVPNANWYASPPDQPLIINGTYTCDDSDPATWSQNAASFGQGFCTLRVQTAQPMESGTSAGGCGAVDVTSTGPLQVVVGHPYSLAFEASGGTPGYRFAVGQGSLPPGLAFSGVGYGYLSGRPTQIGSYTLTVTANDSTSPTPCVSSKTVTVVVTAPPQRSSGAGTIRPAAAKTQKEKDYLMKVDNTLEGAGTGAAAGGGILLTIGASLGIVGSGVETVGAVETVSVVGAPKGIPTFVAGAIITGIGATFIALGKHYANASIDPPDPNFNVVAKPGRLMTLRLRVPPGASRAGRDDIDAVNAEMANLGEVNDVLDVMITSNNRATGARVAQDRNAESRQLHAVATYALLAAELTLRDVALRQAIVRAFNATHLTVTANAQALTAVAHSVARNGLPAQVTTALRAFGLTTGQMQAVTGLLAQPSRASANALGPLESPRIDSAERGAAGVLRSFALKALAAIPHS
jgi:hypothetical protein